MAMFRNVRQSNPPGLLRDPGDWVVPVGVVRDTVPAFAPTAVWGVPFGIDSFNSVIHFHMVQLPAALPLEPPTIGTVEIARIRGVLCFEPNAASLAGSALVMCGLYISQFVAKTGRWTQLDPRSSAEAGRDEWLWLGSVVIDGSGHEVDSALPCCDPQYIRLNLPVKLRITTGQALVLVAGVKPTYPTAGFTGFPLVVANVRSLISREI